MRVREVKIKELIRKYKATNNEKVLVEIIKEISDMVYNYPRVVFNRSKDDCSEFYIYFIEDVKKIIKKYNENLASFNTWFNVVLKSRYINWLNKLSYKRKKQVDIILWEDLTLGTDDKNKEEKLFYNIYLSQQNEKYDSQLSKKLMKIYNKMSLSDIILIKLMYYPIDSSIIEHLTKFLNKSPRECYEIYMKAYKENNLIEKQEILKEKIVDLVYKISKIKKKIKYLKIKNMKSETLEIDKLLKQKERAEKLLNETRRKFYKNLQIIDIKGIQKILGLSKSEIYERVQNIRNFLKQELSDFVR